MLNLVRHIALCSIIALVPASAAAQVVKVPPFVVTDVSGSFRMDQTETVDVAVGPDGNAVFVWDVTSHSTPRYGSDWETRRFTQDGTALAELIVGTGANGVEDLQPRIASAVLPTVPGFLSGGGLAYAVAIQDFGTGAARGVFLDVTGAVRYSYLTYRFGGGVSQGHDPAVAVTTTDSPVFASWSATAGGIVGIDLLHSFTIDPTDAEPFVDLVPLLDGSYFVAWGAEVGVRPPAQGSRFDLSTGLPGFPVTLSADSVFRALAVSATGDELAMVGTRPRGATAPNEIWAVRLTPDGVPIGAEFLVHAAPLGTTVAPQIEFDALGNLYIVWSEGGTAVVARAFDAQGVAWGPAVTLASGSTGGDAVRTARFPDGELVNAWTTAGTFRVHGNVVSLCRPTSVCGDGVLDPYCEVCDDPLGNSDVIPDRCRTDCRLPRCNDGVVDSGEGCDDGNATDCDGCSATCTVEVGIACGDGMPYPSCGQTCDDTNAITGDGCGNDCRLERVPGGGSPNRDCYTEWLVDNPANVPLLDKRGNFSARHVCVDDDPRCDFDGGTPGSCTFHLRVCANNLDVEDCTPGTRLLSWALTNPSAAKALRDPALAAVRAALLGVVPPTIVGPSERDVCSPEIAVAVPLRTSASGTKPGRVTLKTRASLYGGETDKDALDLRCLPVGP